ncbi:MAG: CAP domain-containing protein [Chloroflexi bacterium]|nr:CAP domain-containing protein [Chloroflexota bacterium]
MLNPASALAAPAQADPASVSRVLELTNGERQKGGLRTLALSSELNAAAQGYSHVLATTACFEHTCGPVPNFADRIGQAGYRGWTAVAENIAAGYPTPDAVVAVWMSSAGHRDNILSPSYTEIGIGLVSGIGQFGTYWTQEFGSRPPPPADDGAAPGGDDGSDQG